MVCERVFGWQRTQPFAEADDLGTIGGAFGRHQPVTQTGSLPHPVAAIARMAANATGDQQINLALDQLVQAGGLQHPQTNFRMHAAKLRQFEPAQVEAAMHSQLQEHSTRRLQLRGRIRNAAKTIGYARQIGLTGRGQDELLMQPFEQAHAEARLQRFNLLPDRGGCHVQLVRRQLEAEMPRSGFEGAERIEWWKDVSHRADSLTPMGRGLAIDFLALNRTNNALPRGDPAGYGPRAVPKKQEKPDMAQTTRHNPASVHAPSNGYSMGLEISQHRRLLFVSGQVPENPDGSVPDGFEAQCEQAWRNVIAVLKSAGLGAAHLVKINTFLTDKSQVAPNRVIRRKMLEGHEPASTVMIAETVDCKWLLEIEAIAAE